MPSLDIYRDKVKIKLYDLFTYQGILLLIFFLFLLWDHRFFFFKNRPTRCVPTWITIFKTYKDYSLLTPRD